MRKKAQRRVVGDLIENMVSNRQRDEAISIAAWELSFAYLCAQTFTTWEFIPSLRIDVGIPWK